MPQGKHRKTILEVPTEVLVKREGSLGEACALSLPLCLRLTPLLTPAHKPSALNHPRVPHVHPCPWGWSRNIPVLSPSQMTWAPPGVPWGLRGSRV